MGLWAPDVSFFNGEYHVYYNGSTLHSQETVIGLVTNTTHDSADPAYQWVDRGPILESRTGDDFNALDPSILVDSDDSVCLTYGSYWTGIKQRQIDRATGTLLASNPTRYDLASRQRDPTCAPHNSNWKMRAGKRWKIPPSPISPSITLKNSRRRRRAI